MTGISSYFHMNNMNKERYRSGHNDTDSKSVGGANPTRVRIPPSPPDLIRRFDDLKRRNLSLKNTTRYAVHENEDYEPGSNNEVLKNYLHITSKEKITECGRVFSADDICNFL